MSRYMHQPLTGVQGKCPYYKYWFRNVLGAVHILRNTWWGGGRRRGLPDLLQYYIGGVSPIYYNITRGRGGSLGTPNLYYVIYGWPLIEDWIFWSDGMNKRRELFRIRNMKNEKLWSWDQSWNFKIRKQTSVLPYPTLVRWKWNWSSFSSFLCRFSPWPGRRPPPAPATPQPQLLASEIRLKSSKGRARTSSQP